MARFLPILLVLLWSSLALARPNAPGGSWAELTPQSIASPENRVRVWWVTSGPDAAKPGDSDNNGIPDIVETVAAEGDAIYAYLEAEGWRFPLEDTEVVSDPARNGGDALLDVYLVDFRAGDGQFARDGCLPATGTTPSRCAGHMLIENDFVGTYYPTVQEAVGVVLSHEVFHGVQMAYVAELETWWSEGSATWFEEAYNPDQRDFEGLASGFFANSERPLNDRNRGPTDSFAYATALFPYSLSLAHGNDVVREIFEEMDSDDPLPAIETVLASRETNLADAFDLFALWNGLTGPRANGEGYPQAATFPFIEPIFLSGSQSTNWELDVSRLSARYGWIRPERRTSVRLEATTTDPPTLMLVNLDEETLMLAEGEADLEIGSRWLIIASNGSLEARKGQVQLREAQEAEPEPEPEPEPQPEPEPEPEPQPEPNSDTTDDGGCSHTGSSNSGLFLCFLIALFRRKSKRRN